MNKPIRLINANELDYSPLSYIGEFANISIKDLKSGWIKLIAAQPTAYNVEEVLKQLDNVLCDEINQCVANEVAAIVKAGGKYE